MAKKYQEGDPGTQTNPIDRCGDMTGRPGDCILVTFPDPWYPGNKKYVRMYDPTDEEAAGYTSHQWINEIGDSLFNAVFGFFNKGIEAASGGIITEWLGEGHTLESLLQQVVNNSSEFAVTLLDDASTKLTGLVTSSLNTSAAAMSEFLGVAKAQETIAGGFMQLVDEALIHFGLMEDETANREEEIGEAVAEEFVAETAAVAQRFEFATDWLASTSVELLEEERVSLSEATYNLFEFVTNDINASLPGIAEMAEQHGTEAAVAVASVANERLALVYDALVTGVLHPMAQAEWDLITLKEARVVSTEEFRGSIAEQTLAQMMLAKDLLESGKTPLEFLQDMMKED